MRQAPIDELLKHCTSIYKLVIVAARRAKELAEGSPRLIHTDLQKAASIALEEIHQGKVLYKPSDDAGESRGGRKPKERKEGGKARHAEPAEASGKKKRA